MEFSENIFNELKEISPLLANMERTNIFSVPENYFANFSGEILGKINGDFSFPMIASEDHAFKVPEEYFENLAGNILNKIKNLEAGSDASESEQVSPLLYSLKNKNVFTVPDGYFENLVSIVSDKVSAKPAAKVVSMKSYFWNYAAAAIVTGIIAISSLWVSNKSLQQPSVEQTNVTAFVPASYLQEALKYKNEQQIEEGISRLSDEEIIKYLELTDNDADTKELAVNTDEKDLPSQQDYLLDEKTLDKYLDQIDSKPSAN